MKAATCEAREVFPRKADPFHEGCQVFRGDDAHLPKIGKQHAGCVVALPVKIEVFVEGLQAMGDSELKIGEGRSVFGVKQDVHAGRLRL